MMIFNVNPNPYDMSDEDYALAATPIESTPDFDFGALDATLAADADALASIGWGTDEDYYAGGEDSYIDSYWESLYEMD